MKGPRVNKDIQDPEVKLVSQDQEVKLDLKDPRVEMDAEVSKDREVIGGYRVSEVKRAMKVKMGIEVRRVKKDLKDLQV